MVLHKTITLAALICVLVGCGSTSNKIAAPIKSAPEILPSAPEKVQAKTPEEHLQDADVAERNGQNIERDRSILLAAQAYKDMQSCAQALRVIDVASPYFTNNMHQAYGNLISAECYLDNPRPDYQTIASLIDNISTLEGFEQRSADVIAAYHIHAGNFIEAAKSLAVAEKQDRQRTIEVWELLQNVSTKTLSKPELINHTDLAPWVQLTLIVQEYGLQPDALPFAVKEWQSRFENHPLRNSLPDEVSKAISVPSINKHRIAVLLPLSGSLSKQSLAIKEGILAAYFDQFAPLQKPQDLNEREHLVTLDFIDTQDKTSQQLLALTADHDTVIGPLLRSSLADFVNLAPIQQNIVGLNRLRQDYQVVQNTIINAQSSLNDTQNDLEETSVSQGYRAYFALSPEDEAWQLAETVFNTGAKRPIVISHASGASKRMADTFVVAWQSFSQGTTPDVEVATFVDNKTMRSGLTSLLDVEQSKERISRIERLTSHQIHAVPRNRKDIDSIVLFSTPEQTELLNPIVEASLSPFNNRPVPVYASSRSYSQNISQNSLRDLRNITFTDMPWMLPEADDDSRKQLRQEFAAVWPEQDDTLRRLFALGFDAFQLLDALPYLSVLPQVSVQGLTGQLSVDTSGNVVRKLPFAKITENEVSLIALD